MQGSPSPPGWHILASYKPRYAIYDLMSPVMVLITEVHLTFLPMMDHWTL